MIGLVLDTSAIKQYAAGSIHVGEPISEVHEEGGQVAVPVACLAAAARDAEDHMLRLLVQHRLTVLVPMVVDDWHFLARNVRLLGRLELAAAMLSATDHGAHVLTAEPEAYGDTGRDAVIGI